MVVFECVVLPLEVLNNWPLAHVHGIDWCPWNRSLLSLQTGIGSSSCSSHASPCTGELVHEGVGWAGGRGNWGWNIQPLPPTCSNRVLVQDYD